MACIFALQKGLFADGRLVPRGVGNSTFREFGMTIGLPEKTVVRELDRFTADYPEVESMVKESFLSEKSKDEYYSHYHTRLVSFLRD